MDVFEQAFAFVVGHEGGYGSVLTDPGNWTGGRCGAGECRGTNWGISAASYPQLDIQALTKSQAEEIYRHDYRDRAGARSQTQALAQLHSGIAWAPGLLIGIVMWLDHVAGCPASWLGSLAVAAIPGKARLPFFEAAGRRS